MPDGTQVSRNNSAVLVTVPNIITFARLCAVPLAFWLVIDQHPAYAFFLFVAAGISDAVDGWLARRWGGNSVGALLDPVADKALLVTMYVTLAAVEELPDWLAILVVFRDLVIVGGVLVLHVIGQPVAIRPLYVSKLNTVLQIMLVALTLMLAGFGLTAPAATLTLIWAVAATTLASGAAYLGLRSAADERLEPAPISAAVDHTPEPSRSMPLPPTRGQRIALGIGLLVVAWLALQLFASVLAPFAAAAVIAYALDPPTTYLTRLGIPRGLAALAMILAMLFALLLFALLLYPLILSQIGLFLGRVPQYVQLLQDWARQEITHLQENFGSDMLNDKLRDLVSSQAGRMLSVVASTVTGVIGSGLAIFNLLTLAVVTPVVGFYLLRDWQNVIRRVDSWLPRRYAAVIRAQAREVDRILSAWVRGQAMCCLILALYYALALTIAGLDLGLIVGLAAGLLSFIPYVGSITGGVTAIGLAMAQFPLWRGVFVVIGVLIVGQILEGYVIYPRFLGDRVELPAVWVIFALFAGGAAFGFLGIMLAVPVAATIGVLCRFWLRRYLSSQLYLDPPTP